MVTRSKNTSRKQTGTPTAKPATVPDTSSNGSGPSDRELVRKLYASLLKCRLVEARQHISNPRRYEFVVGGEAVAVGGASDLTAGDTLAASPRDLAALVVGGGVFVPDETAHPGNRSLLSPRLGEALGNGASGGPASLLSLASLSDDPFTLGTGLALAHKLDRKQRVVVAMVSQVSSLEPWREAFQIAVSQRLPIVYLMKNGVAESEHAALLQPVSFLARAGRFPGIVVDGQDVVAVRRVTQESIHRARNRGGPTLVDCRIEPERDPLAHLEHYMRKRGLWDDGWRKRELKQLRAEVDALKE